MLIKDGYLFHEYSYQNSSVPLGTVGYVDIYEAKTLKRIRTINGQGYGNYFVDGHLICLHGVQGKYKLYDFVNDKVLGEADNSSLIAPNFLNNATITDNWINTYGLAFTRVPEIFDFKTKRTTYIDLEKLVEAIDGLDFRNALEIKDFKIDLTNKIAAIAYSYNN